MAFEHGRDEVEELGLALVRHTHGEPVVVVPQRQILEVRALTLRRVETAGDQVARYRKILEVEFRVVNVDARVLEDPRQERERGLRAVFHA
jgi:hypothetical protein